MKKFLSLSALLVLLLAAFLAGTWFNQHEENRPDVTENTRKILHYVDPMNPSHITKEPGIAPCGMPMVPVYADMENSGSASSKGSPSASSPGVVRIGLQKQQIIGVEIGKVEKKMATHSFRALGKVAADENRTYTVIAATDGWMGEIHESTTGSLVRKDQLMAQIRVYDYDFFTWQQRYLTEMGNTGRRPVYAIFPGQAVMDGSAGKTEVTLPPAVPTQLTKGYPSSVPWGIPPGATEYGQSEKQMPPDSPVAGQKQEPAKPGKPPENMAGMSTPPKGTEPPAGTHAGMKHSTPPPVAPPKMDHSLHKMNENGEMKPMREDDILYASKARLELIDLGVGETQLAELVKTGIYVTRLDLRSPVDGLVLSRNVSPRQWIARGTECFRVADVNKVWIEVDIYDAEAQFIQPGVPAIVVLPGHGGRYEAQVSEVPPRFDAATRTLKVRLEVDNPGNVLRPEMFVDVDFQVPLPEALIVPAAAVVDTGLRKTVYIATGEGVFEPREVRTGWHFGDQVEIVEGLNEGDSIVVAGKFLIDSESRMKLAAVRLMAEPAQQANMEKKGMDQAKMVLQKPLTAMQNKKSATTAVDPVCGMEIQSNEETEKAGLTTKVQGQTYYFCSADCKEQFDRNPQGYINKGKTVPLLQDDEAHMGHSHD